jgi:hypothetical protein
MSKPTIHGHRRVISASSILEAIASDLLQIKMEDRLTFADIGRVVGKSEDQAAKYCDGTAEMGITAFGFAKAQWNGRFTGSFDTLIQSARGDFTSDREKESHILKAALALSVALTDDDLTDAEIRDNRATLEAAKDSIDALMRRIAPRSAA